jgi:hypothetical protein
MDGKFRVGIISLLSGILIMQVALYFRIPNIPTRGEFIAAAKAAPKDNRREAIQRLRMKLPMVYVEGSVDIEGTVNVEVENTPLDVEIVR